MILFIIGYIVLALTVVYLLIFNQRISSALTDHKKYIEKCNNALFSKEIGFIAALHGLEPTEINRLEQLEKKVDEAINVSTNRRKMLEQYLGITYVKSETKTEGYEKSNFMNYSGAVVTYANTGSCGNCVFEKEEVKKPKKVAKKSKKK